MTGRKDDGRKDASPDDGKREGRSGADEERSPDKDPLAFDTALRRVLDDAKREQQSEGGARSGKSDMGDTQFQPVIESGEVHVPDQSGSEDRESDREGEESDATVVLPHLEDSDRPEDTDDRTSDRASHASDAETRVNRPLPSETRESPISDEDDSSAAETRVEKTLGANDPATRKHRLDETQFQPAIEADHRRARDDGAGQGRSHDAPTRVTRSDPSREPPEATLVMSSVPADVLTEAESEGQWGRPPWIWVAAVGLVIAISVVITLLPGDREPEPSGNILAPVLALQTRSLERATQLSSKVTEVLTRSRQVRLELADLDLKLQSASEVEAQTLKEQRDDLALLAARLGEQAILIRDHVLSDVDLAIVEQMAGALPVDPSEAEVARLQARYGELIDKLERALVNQQRLETAVAARQAYLGAVSEWRSFGFSWPVEPEELTRLVADASAADMAAFQFPDPTDEAQVLLAAGRFEEATAAWKQGSEDLAILIGQASARTELSDTRVRSLLAAAELALENRHLTSPEDDNALMYYRQVLDMDADNEAALIGLERIIEAYETLLNNALSADRIQTAETYLARAENVDAQSSEVAAMRQRLEAARGAWQVRRQGELMTRLESAAEARDLTLAEAAVGELRGLTSDVVVLEKAERRLREIARMPGRLFRDATRGGGQGPEMVVLPTGEFEMGSSGRQLARLFGAGRNEAPAHRVRVSDPIAMAVNEITVRQFGLFVAATGYRSDAERAGEVDGIGGGGPDRFAGRDWRHDFRGEQAAPDMPVIHVSYNDALAYAEWLAEVSGEDYRLPSESEFEFALRAGLDTRHPWGNGDLADSIANLNGEQDALPSGWRQRPEGKGDLRRYRDGHFGPAPVGSFAASAFGLNDMLGNVAEWVGDCYLPDFKGKGASQYARGGEACRERTVRGASWASEDDSLRASWRLGRDAGRGSNTIGFRVVRAMD